MFFPSSKPVRPAEPAPVSSSVSPVLAMPAARVSYGPSSAADPNEGRRYGGAFWVSAILHGLAVALLLIFTFALREKIDEQPKIFELVAGPGDDFMATEAPAGSEAGLAKQGEIEFTAPESVPNWTPPAQAATPVEPVEVPPTPVEPVAPVTPVTPPKPKPVVETPPVPNFAKDLKSTIRQEKKKVDREIKKQRAADEAAAKAAAAEAAKKKQSSYDQFQKQNGVKTTGSTSAGATSPGKRIDAGSIKRGVTGATGAGSTGAGGTALSAAEGERMERYFTMLIQRLRDSHEKPGGLSDLLNAEVQFTVAANGVISGVKIVRSSGNTEFDQSVLEAFGRVKMPARPDAKTDVQRLTFRIKEA